MVGKRGWGGGGLPPDWVTVLAPWGYRELGGGRRKQTECHFLCGWRQRVGRGCPFSLAGSWRTIVAVTWSSSTWMLSEGPGAGVGAGRV